MQITNFTIPENPAVSGIQEFRFIETKNLLQMPFPLHNKIISHLSMLPGTTFWKGYSTRQNCILEVKPNNLYIPDFFNVKLSGFYPDLSPEMISMFEEMSNKEFVILVRDSQQKRRLIGTHQTPMLFNYTEVSENIAPGRKGMEFYFWGAQLRIPPFFDPL